LKLIGTGPGCNTRVFTLYKVIAIGAAEYHMSRENETSLPVEFEALKDPLNNNQFGWVLEF
jgi:hypothetical protein